ncbi:hypothetical protein [Streptomyces sp. NPDC005435]|uniref:hypothetical protein n=1 Tax=Streptomyces sp. NPDC005435 TaxID=3154464 RepID=UPI003454DD21
MGDFMPQISDLVYDTSRDKVGEFRGEWCGQWSLRPITGGREWTVAPESVQPASPEQRLQAKTARANARSRGEYL